MAEEQLQRAASLCSSRPDVTVILMSAYPDILSVLLVQSLIERELCQAMGTNAISELPLYPGERTTNRPTAEQVFRLFCLVQRHSISHHQRPLHTLHPELTALEQQVPDLLEVP